MLNFYTFFNVRPLTTWLLIKKQRISRFQKKFIYDALVDINNNLQCKQNIIATFLHETTQHLKTENEHPENEEESQREVIKVLQ